MHWLPWPRGLKFATLGLGAILALAASPAFAGTQALGTPVGETGNVTLCANPEQVLMVTIPSSRQAGGNDATSTRVSVGGTVVAADVAAIRVVYDVLAAGSVTNPATLTDVDIALPGNQKGGADWTYYVDLNPSAAGKTFSLTVTSITGTDNGNLPYTTVTRNALACAFTTTLGDGTDPAAAPTICPGDPATMMDAFSFVTSGNSDDVGDVTVGLLAGSAQRLSKVEITDAGGGTVYGEIDNPATDTLVVALTLNTLTATTSPADYRVRVTPKTNPALPAPPGGTYTIEGTVAAFTPATNLTSGSDTDSDTVSIDNLSPGGATFMGCTGISASQIDLTWNNPVDADLAGVVVVRGPVGGTCPGFSPTEGTTYATGPQGADEVVYVGSLEAFSDTTGLAESMSYCYEVWAYDGCANYFEGPPNSTTCSTQAAGNITTLGNGTDPSAGPTLCPGDSATILDAFSFVTDGNSDNVDDLTVTLAATTGESLGLLEITSSDGVTVYGQVTDPVGDSPTVDLTAPPVLTATNGLTEYRVRITPKSHAAMPTPQGSSYAVGGTVSAFTPTTNATAGSDPGSDTVTIDNLSPNNASWGAITPGDSQVVLNWTINDGVEVVILRKAAPPPISDAPVEGIDYTGLEGTTIGASTIVYVGSGSTTTDTSVANNTNYYYKIFARDGCFNYSTGVQDGPYTPSAPNNGTTTQAPSASVDGCNQITVSAPFSGDDNNDGSTLFESGPSGSGPWTTVAGCAGVTGASPRVCIDVNVAESSTYYYQVTYIDDVDGVTGLNPRTTGPHLTPACAADDTTVVDNSAEANSCRQMTSSSFFDGDANGDGWTQVEYNTSATWPGIVACERATGPSPRQCVIPELTPGQSYWLRFTYNDLDGVTATAPPNPHQIGPIAVPACGTDEAAPTVLILSPRRDAVVGGTDRVKVQVYETNLSTVEWSVNSENDLDLAAASLNSNYACGTDCVVYEFDLVTTGLANDTHYLTIKATDVEGNFARVKHAFRVNNSDGKAAGDGLLLRRTRGSQLCIDCHNLPTHSSQSTSHDYGNWALDCLTCHTPHQTKNIYLIEDSVRTPNSGERSVDLRDLGGVADYGLAELSDASGGSNTLEPGVGLCETCHTRTKNSDDSPRYRNTGEGGNGHAEGACIVCHTHEVGFSGAGGACDNCHFAPPTVGKHGSHDQVGSVPSDYGTTTSHATATEYGFACSKCHTGGHINDNAPNHDGSMTWPWEVEVLFDDTADPMNPTGAYAGTYNENQDQGPDGDWWSWSDGSCSDLYCHSRAVPLGGTDAFATVSWDQVATLDCTSCHDTAGDTTTLSNLSPAHRIHTDTDRYDFRCVRCHVNTITVTTNDAIADKREHVDGEKDVFFDSSGVNNAGGSYDDVAYRCSDTYCHSNGQVQTPPYSSGPSIAWDSTATCRSCHGGDATGTPTMASGKHPNHVNNASFIGTNYDCITCHAATVSANETVNDFGNHVNGTSNVSGTNVGTWSDPTCTSSYCHSSGQAAPQYYTMNWGTDTIDDCKGCHGRYTPEDFTSIAGEPNYANGGAGAATANSHSKHVGAATDCTNCHNSTTTTGTEIINGATIHTDGTRDVDIAATWDTNGGAGNYDPTPGNKTCSGIKCHGPGTPQWGETIDLCLDCHDGPDGGSLGDGTPNGVGDEWATDGHGSSAGGSFTSTMGGCDYCHQLDAGHTPTASTNPYRLRFTPNDNSLCLRCHLSDSDPGINDNSETTALTPINSSKNVGTAHFGAKHQTGEGGELCWDCHDPHGVPTNILMVKDLVSQSSDQYGVPGATVTVTFTDNTTAGQAVGRFTEETNTPRQGICQACHDPTKPGTESTKYWRNDGTDDPDGQGGASPIDPSVHNAAKLCSDCHSHTDNFKGAGDDCLGCHQNDSQVGTFTRRAVGADFTKNSHHVGSGGTYMGGSLTNFDCAVCHLEGFVDTAADPDEVKTSDTYHGFNGGTTTIDLRNSDDNSLYAYDKSSMPAAAADWNSGNATWRTQTSTALDPFCLSCHDSDGATHLTAAPNEGGGTASNPFNDLAITNEYDRQPRGGVVNIGSMVVATTDQDVLGEARYDEVCPGGPPCTEGIADPPQGVYSRHAIRGQSLSVYGTQQVPNQYWVQTEFAWNDASVMGCADCHTTDGANTTSGNAHGSDSEYLLKDAGGLATEGDYDTLSYVCYRCHSSSYYSRGQTENHTDNDSDWVHSSGSDGTARLSGNGNIFGTACTNCHGGTAWGAIHGSSETFSVGDQDPPSTTTREAYRFMNGASLRYYDPGDWTTGAVACWTLSGADSWGGCTQHDNRGKDWTRANPRPLSY